MILIMIIVMYFKFFTALTCPSHVASYAECKLKISRIWFLYNYIHDILCKTDSHFMIMCTPNTLAM